MYQLRFAVQLPLTGPWGTPGEIARREELAGALEEDVREEVEGRFEGVEDGVGKTTLVFSHLEWEPDLNLLPAILGRLRERDLLDRAVVAVRVRWLGTDGPDEGAGEDAWQVLWPEGYAGQFEFD